MGRTRRAAAPGRRPPGSDRERRARPARLARGRAPGAIEADDAAVARLYPPAYRDDERANDEFGRLTRGELTAGRVAALRTLESTCRDTELTEADANAWCGALNDLRLVLGERLGVTEELYEVGIDPNDPRAPELALYGWLTWLQGELVESLSARL